MKKKLNINTNLALRKDEKQKIGKGNQEKKVEIINFTNKKNSEKKNKKKKTKEK